MNDHDPRHPPAFGRLLRFLRLDEGVGRLRYVAALEVRELSSTTDPPGALETGDEPGGAIQDGRAQGGAIQDGREPGGT